MGKVLGEVLRKEGSVSRAGAAHKSILASFSGDFQGLFVHQTWQLSG